MTIKNSNNSITGLPAMRPHDGTTMKDRQMSATSVLATGDNNTVAGVQNKMVRPLLPPGQAMKQQVQAAGLPADQIPKVAELIDLILASKMDQDASDRFFAVIDVFGDRSK